MKNLDETVCIMKCIDCDKKMRVSSAKAHLNSKEHSEKNRNSGFTSPVLMTLEEYNTPDNPVDQKELEEKLAQARRAYSMKYYNANKEIIAERCKNRYSSDMVQCEQCDKTIGRSFWDKHIQCKSHIKNTRLAELERLVQTMSTPLQPLVTESASSV